MKIEINIENTTQQALSELANRHALTIEQVTEIVINEAIESQQTKLDALKSKIDRAYERGGSNTSEEVAASIRSSLS